MDAPRRWLAVGVALAAVFSFSQAGWIHAKAWTAQWLLDRAWMRAERGATDIHPWPWADTRPVGELAVPRLGRRLVVLEAAGGRALSFAPALVAGSASFDGYGNAVVTGHRDTHFAFLRDLIVGDLVEVRTRRGRMVSYRIDSLFVAHVDELRLSREALRRELTLVTCYPFDAVTPGGPFRYVVRASEMEIAG